MTVEDIIAKLGINLKNADAKRGALEAIDAIIASRMPPPPTLGGRGGRSEGDKPEEIEIDPDLMLPSVKHAPQPGSADDIEIDDEDDVLSQLKRNDSDYETQSSSTSDGAGDDNELSNAEDSSSEDPDRGSAGNGSSSSDQTEESDSDNDAGRKSGNGEQPTSDQEDSENNDMEAEGTSDGDGAEDSDTEDSDADGGDGSEDGEGDDGSGSAGDQLDDDQGGSTEDEEGSETDSDDGDLEEPIDETDLIDDAIQQALTSDEILAKERARKIKRARTVQAAEAALQKAKQNKVPQPLIHELEQALNALTSIQEAAAKRLQDLSDDEFNMAINRVLDAIDACGDHDLTFTSDEERQLTASEIKADLEDPNTARELSAEDTELIRSEHQAIQAREKEADKYKTKSRDSFKGFQDFLISLTRAMAMQVKIDDEQEDSWSAINRRYSGTNVLKQGRRVNDLPNNTIPIIDFYFDCSASWSSRDIAIGKKAAQALAELEEQGKIKVNLYYFSNDVFSDFASAEAQGGTRAWNEIVKNIITTQATNVVIMTDDDMEDWWWPQDKPALRYTVPGYVWYLWKNGSNAPRLPRDLKGRSGTQQFSFNGSDL